MRVLLANTRVGWMTEWGGDTTQVIETANGLRGLGIDVDVAETVPTSMRGFDLLHVFNLQTARWGMPWCDLARREHVPIALSTIWWDMRYCSDYGLSYRYHNSRLIRLAAGIFPSAVDVMSRIKPRLNGDRAAMVRLLGAADVVLPNSYAEAEIVVLQFAMPQLRGRTWVVPNAFSSCLNVRTGLHALPDDMAGRCVMEVASISYVKGQLFLLEALLDKPSIPLVFVGRSVDQYYARVCRQLAEKRGNVLFVGEVPHSDVLDYVQQARVHALPSLRESPGLASLEAAGLGIPIVVSVHAPIGEYFGDMAHVCEPTNVASVRQAVLHAWEAPAPVDLQTRLNQHNRWAVASRTTLDAYVWLLQSRRLCS